MNEVAVAFRFGLATIFFFSGLAKLANLEQFEGAVREYRIVPHSLSGIAAIAIPLTETVLGICLFLGILLRPAAIAVAALLVAFSAAISLNLAQGRRHACGCFGTLSQSEISVYAVFRNVIFIGLAVALSQWTPTALAVNGKLGMSASASISTSDAVAMLITGTAVAFLVSMAQEVVALMRLRASLERTMAETA
jgi:uncharacterized membrane protein YphA (DoxX/SURF4 family)